MHEFFNPSIKFFEESYLLQQNVLLLRIYYLFLREKKPPSFIFCKVKYYTNTTFISDLNIHHERKNERNSLVNITEFLKAHLILCITK